MKNLLRCAALTLKWCLTFEEVIAIFLEDPLSNVSSYASSSLCVTRVFAKPYNIVPQYFFLGNCVLSLGFFQYDAHTYCLHAGCTKLLHCAIVRFLKKIFPNLCQVLYSYRNVHFNCLNQAKFSFNLYMSIFLYHFYLKLHRNADLYLWEKKKKKWWIY